MGAIQFNSFRLLKNFNNLKNEHYNIDLNLSEKNMPSMLAIVSKAVFEREARTPNGRLLSEGDCYQIDRYNSTSPFLKPVLQEGSIYLITVRPGDILWLVAVLERPTFRESAFISSTPNSVSIIDITALINQFTFSTGKGIHCEPGKLGMSLQTPRILTNSDEAMLKKAINQAPSKSSIIVKPISQKKVPNIKVLDKDILAKLKKILKVSVRIRMDQMRDILKMDQATFNDKIIDWADEFGFIIDGDYINVKKDNVDDFINMLDNEFKAWEEKESLGLEKIENPNLNDFTVKIQREQLQNIVVFRGAQISQFEANVLQMLEDLAKERFFLVEYIDWNTKMGFSIANDRVSGIGLYKCGLRALPESIGQLKSLQILDLSNNQISILPESIAQLKSLQDLSLGYNQFSTLPESIGQLSSLKALWLKENQISILPESIANLTSLQTLDVRGNPLETSANALLKRLKKNGVDIKF